MQGIELSRRFYQELVRPWLANAAPGLPHAAALLGYGSELLGFDDAMSQDHNWGPRVHLFVDEPVFESDADAMVAAFAEAAPDAFLGHPIGMANQPHAAAHRQAGRADVRHGLEIWTLARALRFWAGLAPGEPRDNLGWLGLAEQRLIAFTAGAVFHDDDRRLTAERERLSRFPRDVRLYRLAGQWRRLAEEQPFVGRNGAAGEERGSRVIAARLVRDLMRLAFLIEGRYAPYSKWFGTAFAALPCATDIGRKLDAVLDAADWRTRDAALAEAALSLGELQLTRGVPGAIPPRIVRFHERPFSVVNSEAMISALMAAIDDAALRALPVIGGLDQVTDSTPVVEAPDRARRAMAALLHDLEPGPVEEA
ncbi:MAG TPA: DUF4037 domain-containing protein [Caulobacteraceae bacterium]|nr:DUF4037 domain-containing protein [Caulobacteraceae bacterium]